MKKLLLSLLISSTLASTGLLALSTNKSTQSNNYGNGYVVTRTLTDHQMLDPNYSFEQGDFHPTYFAAVVTNKFTDYSIANRVYYKYKGDRVLIGDYSQRYDRCNIFVSRSPFYIESYSDSKHTYTFESSAMRKDRFHAIGWYGSRTFGIKNRYISEENYFRGTVTLASYRYEQELTPDSYAKGFTSAVYEGDEKAMPVTIYEVFPG